MKTFIISLVSSLLIMVVIDYVWLTTMSKSFYGKYLGHLLAEKPNLIPAVMFYVIYIVAISVIVVLPALQGNFSIGKVFLLGAFLGLTAYATYDLTNQATLKNWPTIVTIVDLIWGTVLTGTVSTITVLITRYFS